MHHMINDGFKNIYLFIYLFIYVVVDVVVVYKNIYWKFPLSWCTFINISDFLYFRMKIPFFW